MQMEGFIVANGIWATGKERELCIILEEQLMKVIIFFYIENF